MSIYTVSSVQDDIKKEEPVVFNVPKEIPSQKDFTIQYKLRNIGTPLDWIGIFQSGFRDTGQPLMFYWAPTKPVDPKEPLRRSIEIPASHIQSLDDGSFQFVYVNKEKKLLGVSTSFTILKRPMKPEKSPVTSESWADTDSPVMMSSDEEWQLASPSPSLQERSSSDLSDIVVLSTSPSKESTKRNTLHTCDTPVEVGADTDSSKQNGEEAKSLNGESDTTDGPKRSEPKANVRKKVKKCQLKEQKNQTRTCLDGSTIVSPVEKKNKNKVSPVVKLDYKEQMDLKVNIEKSENDVDVNAKLSYSPMYHPACSDEQEIKASGVADAGGLTGRKIKKVKRRKKITRKLTPLVSDIVLLSEPFSGLLDDTGPNYCDQTTQMKGDNGNKTEQPFSDTTIASPYSTQDRMISELIKTNAVVSHVLGKDIKVLTSQIDEDKIVSPIFDENRNIVTPEQIKTRKTLYPAVKENSKVVPLDCKTNSLLIKQDDVVPYVKECDSRRDEEHKEQAFSKQRFRNLMSTHKGQVKKKRKQIKNYLKLQPLIIETEQQPLRNVAVVSSLGLNLPSLEDTSEQGFPSLPKRGCDHTVKQQSDVIAETTPPCRTQQYDANVKTTPPCLTQQYDANLKTTPPCLTQQYDATVKTTPPCLTQQYDANVKTTPPCLTQQYDANVKTTPPCLTQQYDATVKTISSCVSQAQGPPVKETNSNVLSKPTEMSVEVGLDKVKAPTVTCNKLKSKYKLKKKWKFQEKSKEFLWDAMDEIKNIYCNMLTTPDDSAPPEVQVCEKQIQTTGTTEATKVQVTETQIQTTGTTEATKVQVTETQVQTTGTTEATKVQVTETQVLTTGTTEATKVQVTETQVQTTGTTEASEVQANELKTQIQSKGQSTKLTATTSESTDNWNFQTGNILLGKADHSDTMTNQLDSKTIVTNAPLSYANVVKMTKCNVSKENSTEIPECLEVGTCKEQKVNGGDCTKQCEETVHVDKGLNTYIQDATATIDNTLETRGYSLLNLSTERVINQPTPSDHGQNGSADISADSVHDTSNHDCRDSVPSCRETIRHDCGMQWSKTAALKRVARLIRRRARLLVDQQIHRRREKRLEQSVPEVGNSEKQGQSSRQLSPLARTHSGNTCSTSWRASNLLMKPFGNDGRHSNSCLLDTSNIVDKVPVVPMECEEDTSVTMYAKRKSAAQDLPSRLALYKRKGQTVKTLRTHTEILALKSQLKANKMEIQSLHHQVNVLKTLLHNQSQPCIQPVEKDESEDWSDKPPPRKKMRLSDEKDYTLWRPDFNKCGFVPEVKKICSSDTMNKNIQGTMLKPFTFQSSIHNVHNDNTDCPQRYLWNEKKTKTTDVYSETPSSDMHKHHCCRQESYMNTSSNVPHRGCKTNALCPGGIYCQSSQVDNILTHCHEPSFCWSACTQTDGPAPQTGHCCPTLINAHKQKRDNATDIGHCFSLSVLGKYAACPSSSAKTFQCKDFQNEEATVDDAEDSPTYKGTMLDETRNETLRPANCFDTSHYQSCFMKALVHGEKMKQANSDGKERKLSEWLRLKNLVDRKRQESENVDVDKLFSSIAFDQSCTPDSTDDPDHSLYWNHSVQTNPESNRPNVSVKYMPTKRLLLKANDMSDSEREIQGDTNSSLYHFRRLIEALEAKKGPKHVGGILDFCVTMQVIYVKLINYGVRINNPIMPDDMLLTLVINLVATLVFFVILSSIYLWLNQHPVQEPDDTTENWLSHLSETSDSRRPSGSFASENTDFRLNVSACREKHELTASGPCNNGKNLYGVTQDDAYNHRESTFFKTTNEFSEIKVRDGKFLRRREQPHREK